MEELSQDILKGLELLGDAQQIPDQAFKEITECSFGIILKKVDEERLAGIFKSHLMCENA
jgi:hypothetical protein